MVISPKQAHDALVELNKEWDLVNNKEDDKAEGVKKTDIKISSVFLRLKVIEDDGGNRVGIVQAAPLASRINLMLVEESEPDIQTTMHTLLDLYNVSDGREDLYLLTYKLEQMVNSEIVNCRAALRQIEEGEVSVKKSKEELTAEIKELKTAIFEMKCLPVIDDIEKGSLKALEDLLNGTPKLDNLLVESLIDVLQRKTSGKQDLSPQWKTINNLINRYKQASIGKKGEVDNLSNLKIAYSTELSRKRIENFSNSLEDDTTKVFKDLIYCESKLDDQLVSYLIDTLKTKIGGFQELPSQLEALSKIIQRYESISVVKIEKEGGINNLDYLKIAYLIEEDILKVEHLADKKISKKRGVYPRTVIIEEGGKRAIILSKKQLSVKRGKGGFKDIKSALIVSLESTSAKVERVVYAKIMSKTKKSAVEALSEYRVLDSFSGSPGFATIHKFFCFDFAGNQVTIANLEVEGDLGKVKTAIVLEEFDSDLCQVVSILNLNQQVSITKSLVQSLDAMRRKGKASWDLKPQNVIAKIEKSGEIKIAITDFGLFCNFDGINDKYGSPWNGPPELLYAMSVANDANKHLQCEVWAAGLILYAMYFKKLFQLIDLEYANKYNQVNGLPVDKQISHYKRDYQTYKNDHHKLVEKPLEDLLKIPEQERNQDDKLKILIFSMLKINPEDRFNVDKSMTYTQEVL